MSHAPSVLSRVPGAGPLRSRGIALLVLALVLAAFLLLVRVNVRMHFGGLFLLRGKGWRPLELRDDLFLGEGSRVIAGIDFGPLRRRIYRKHFPERLSQSVEVEWDEAEGYGRVVSRFADGGILATSFSRFLDDANEAPRGLFVGGGEVDSVIQDNLARLTETGMAYHDGKRWYHIWCSANEAIASDRAPETLLFPSAWKFLGSRVLRNGPRRIVLSSSHEVTLDGCPIRIDRFAYFNAGEPYFRLGIRIRNIGGITVPVRYLYGDDPWLGDYGSSRGNVGWHSGGLVERVTEIDTKRHRYLGMFDCGNSLVGPRAGFTNVANFIEWLGGNVPDVAYFSNRPGYDEIEFSHAVPLSSDERFLGLEWGPRVLAPGSETTIFLAVGMAGVDPRTGLPVKPEVVLRSPLP